MTITKQTNRHEGNTGYHEDMAKAKIFDLSSLADHLGVGLTSARTYNNRAAQNRRKAEETGDASHILPGDLPAPDGYVGQSPYWNESTIRHWEENRPGRGGHNKETHKRRLVRESRNAKAAK